MITDFRCCLPIYDEGPIVIVKKKTAQQRQNKQSLILFSQTKSTDKNLTKTN